jgi:hypothetical protein
MENYRENNNEQLKKVELIESQDQPDEVSVERTESQPLDNSEQVDQAFDRIADQETAKEFDRIVSQEFPKGISGDESPVRVTPTEGDAVDVTVRPDFRGQPVAHVTPENPAPIRATEVLSTPDISPKASKPAPTPTEEDSAHEEDQ